MNENDGSMTEIHVGKCGFVIEGFRLIAIFIAALFLILSSISICIFFVSHYA